MSRTDKDLPYWYAEYYEPFHRCADYGRRHRYGEGVGACDLPPEPIVQSTSHHVKFVRRIKDQDKVPAENWGTQCTWSPITNKYTKAWYNRNPKWWMDCMWRNPERARVRDQSKKALQDYNANGTTDIDIANFRRKHEGGWFW